MKFYTIITFLSIIFILSASDEESAWTGLQTGTYGQLNGSLNYYGQDFYNREGSVSRESFGNVYTSLGFQSTEWRGIKLSVEGLYNHETSDNDGAYESVIHNEALIAELNVNYHTDKLSLTIGRWRPDWLMLGDAFEGVFLEWQLKENLHLDLSWIRKMAVFDPDEVINWYDIDDEDDRGISGAELHWEHANIDTAVFLYHSDDFNLYGVLGTWSYEFEKVSNSLFLEIYQSDERGDNGALIHLSDTISLERWALTAGIIIADDDSGAGVISDLNNPWDPFDDDAHVDLPGAESWYLQLNCSCNDKLTISAIYGETDFANSNSYFKQFNLIATYELNQFIAVETAFIHLNSSDDIDGGYNKLWINLSFNF